MRKRLMLWLGISGTVLLAILLLCPAPRFILRGLCNGESFYQYMPSSYWSCRLRDYFDKQERGCNDYEDPSDFETKWLDPIKERTGLGTPSYLRRHCPLQRKNTDLRAMPVLIDLLPDPDARVRMWSVDELIDLGTKAKPAVPALLELVDDDGIFPLWDSDRTVGQAAANAVIQIDPEAAAKAGITADPERVARLIGWLEIPEMRAYAAHRLYHLSYVVDADQFKPAVPLLIDLLGDPSVDDDDDRTAGELADLILKRINR
jgi:hypothetical protein